MKPFETAPQGAYANIGTEMNPCPHCGHTCSVIHSLYIPRPMTLGVQINHNAPNPLGTATHRLDQLTKSCLFCGRCEIYDIDDGVKKFVLRELAEGRPDAKTFEHSSN